MSGAMTTTSNPPAAPTMRIVQRAHWLRSLSPQERDALFDMTLRDVDALFAEWAHRANDPAGGDGR